MPKKPEQLRSARWFVADDLRSFGHRSRMMQMGYAPEDWAGRPVIGILNTWSDLNPCHAHFKSRVDDIKRGVLQAGGLPMELPAISMSETFMKPTTMLYRNLLAMEAEEQIRSQPIDGAVLMGGCDKTTPALIMGALSAGVPMIFFPAGPMLSGNYAGEKLGSGSDAWKFWDERRAGNISERGMARHRRRHRALLRPLHDHGHGLDDDGDRRGDGPDPARRLVDSRRRCRSYQAGLGKRPPHRRDGLGRSHAGQDRHQGGDRQRRQGRHGDRLLDQCGHPPDRHCAARRHRSHARRSRRARAERRR